MKNQMQSLFHAIENLIFKLFLKGFLLPYFKFHLIDIMLESFNNSTQTYMELRILLNFFSD
jgi:hypothetical protein